MKIILIVISISYIVCVVSCTKRYICGLGQYKPEKVTPSEILRFEHSTKNDTTIGNLLGNLVYRDSSSYGVVNTELIFANILAFEKTTRKIRGTQTNWNGDYDLVLPPSRYDIHVVYTTMNNLIVKNLTIKEGDRIILDALIGNGGDSTVYEIQLDGTISNSYLPSTRQIGNK